MGGKLDNFLKYFSLHSMLKKENTCKILAPHAPYIIAAAQISVEQFAPGQSPPPRLCQMAKQKRFFYEGFPKRDSKWKLKS